MMTNKMKANKRSSLRLAPFFCSDIGEDQKKKVLTQFQSVFQPKFLREGRGSNLHTTVFPQKNGLILIFFQKITPVLILGGYHIFSFIKSENYQKQNCKAENYEIFKYIKYENRYP